MISLISNALRILGLIWYVVRVYSGAASDLEETLCILLIGISVLIDVAYETNTKEKIEKLEKKIAELSKAKKEEQL